MELRRSTWGAAIRLAATWSLLSAAIAAVLHTVDVVSQPVIVLGVIVVGFTTSWVRTGHPDEPAICHDVRRHPAHRVVTVPVTASTSR